MAGITISENLNGSSGLPVPNRRIFHPDASIVLVGCRGAGKRTLGFIGATYLHRRLLTEDHYFEQGTGCSRTQFLEKYGRDALNRTLAMVLAQVLESNRFHCVIECGMGTWTQETQELLLHYAETNPVIYVHRDKEDIYKLLKIPVSDAERLFLADQKHREHTNLEYYNLLDTSGEDNGTTESGLRSASMSSARLLKVKEDFARFLDLMTGQGLTRSWVENPFSINAIPPEHRTYSFALRLRLSDLLTQEIDMTELESGADAVELIIDTWPDNILDIIAAQVALIRRKLDLPILYNVEEQPREERQRPKEERDTIDLKLLLHGLRLGVEYLSLDLDRDERLVSAVLSLRGRTKIVGNFTMKGMGAPKWTDPIYLDSYRRAQSLGCSIVRFARFCARDRDQVAHHYLVDQIKALPDPKPQLVAFEYSVLGAVNNMLVHEGSTTPSQSFAFAPVGHNSVKPTSREQFAGVNTTRGALRIMFRDGPLQGLKFYTLGSKVYYSASPSMHRAAYESLMMLHSFDARKCDRLEEVDRIRSEYDFGGACLTAPFKVAMMEHVDHLSIHAKAIGAVNILLPLRGQTSSILDHANARNRGGVTSKFYGDNTDWSSIMTCLRRAISPRNTVHASRTTGLVIGAGGMARAAIYALIKLGCRKIFIYNRTKANAERVAEHFNNWAAGQSMISQQNGNGNTRICHVLETIDQDWPPGYQQPTMIVSCIAAAGDFHDSTIDFRLPLQWLRSPTGGVVLELAYEPLITTLITQMREIRENRGSSWVIIDGLEAVSEMAMEAFELLTGRKAPKTLMRRVCNENWEKNCAPFEPRR
ncbi:type I 3-dehydroquinase-domain-containing protein [Xylariales sp. PMI_506]|nr:type I 3-dehydroquinase-domain-containing protein [Xylariales sp. PMI_506]